MRSPALASPPDLAFPPVADAPAEVGVRRRADRIAILFHDFAAGGSERIMIRLANAWAHAGREVQIVCGNEGGPSRALVEAAVAVRPLAPAIPRGPGSRLRLGRAVRRLLPSLRCDVLVAPGNFHLLALLALGRVQPAVVCKLSNPVGGAGVQGVLGAAAVRLACAHVDGLAAISPALAREARRWLPGRPIPVLPQPNLADAAPLLPPRAPGRPLRLLAAGRLVRQKRFDLALEVLARLPADTHLTIAGDGPEHRSLVRLAGRMGVRHRVEFAGHVPDLSPLFARSDLLLLTSDFEGFPGVVVEALAAGIAVVATPASPALPEILAHPSCGRVVRADPDALADAIRTLGSEARAPDADIRRALLAPLRTGNAAARWLHFLDEVVAERDRAAAPVAAAAAAV